MLKTPSSLIMAALLLFSVALVACRSDAPSPVVNNRDGTPAPTSPQEATPAPNNQPRALLTQSSATPFPTSTPINCDTDQIGRSIRYEIETTLDWESKQMQVNQGVVFRNDHDTIIDELVFHVEPRRLSGTMQFRKALDAQDNDIQNINFDASRLTVPLPEALFPGCTARITLTYLLQIEAYSSSNPIGWLSYSQRQLNVAHWFPVLGLYGYERPGEWYTPRIHFIGEQSISQAANIRVDLTIQNQPEDLQIAAPGQVERMALNSWRFALDGARDFAMSMSSEFRMTAAEVNDISVELYYFPYSDPKTGGSNPSTRAALDARQALELYSEIYGPYPYERLVVVEGDFPDGMEFSSLVFVSEAWFRTWNGQVTDWLTIITVHEVAHQWWYASLGNNQGTTPYLDEALATYSELLYYERYYPDLVDWWWQFRIYDYDPSDVVDATVYDYSAWRPYINAVYLRGCMMFQALRDELGEVIFLQWLSDYAEGYEEQIVDSEDFWGALPYSSYERVASIRQQYLREADILPPLAATSSPTPVIAADSDT